MKICVICGIHFTKKWAKLFCSKPCASKFHHKIEAKKLKEDPTRREARNKRNRDYYRKKNNLDLNAPLLHRKKGTGSYKDGYKVIHKTGHPNSIGRGAIFEHVFIMSNHLGRPLTKGETVHHKNGVRDDNHIENLELWSNRHGKGQRVEDKLNWCKEFLEQYGHTVIINGELVK